MSGPANRRAGRVHFIVGATIFAIGLIALTPALSLIIAKLSGSFLGVYVISIQMDRGARAVLLIMSAAGTAAVVGGAWIITTGYRRKRTPEPSGDLQ